MSLKQITVTEWVTGNAARARQSGKRYVLLCNDAGVPLRRAYVPDPPPEYVSHAGSVFRRQSTGRYWRVTDYPAHEVVEAKSYA